MINPIAFTKESYQELRKASWMPKDQLVSSTIVVAVLSGLVAVFVWGVDFALSQLMRALLGGA